MLNGKDVVDGMLVVVWVVDGDVDGGELVGGFFWQTNGVRDIMA